MVFLPTITLVLLLINVRLHSFSQVTYTAEIDPNGYVMFCPCMGRFGNQAEQFLGALAFTQILNRTLILPHWVEYPPRSITSDQIPFDRYFQVEPLQKYLKVILMKEFMDTLARRIWPEGKRIAFCYSPRVNEEGSTTNSCHAKEGNPFGPYWSHFKIDFDKDVFYEPLYFDISTGDAWNSKYPSAKYPVLAFTGPPGSFPAEQRHVHLAKYMVYSDHIREQAEAFLKTKSITPETMLAVHLRIGIDFERACSHATGQSNFFASAQCLGFGLDQGVKWTNEICYPSTKTILDQTEQAVRKHKPQVLFVASDSNHMIKEFQALLTDKYKVTVVRYDGALENNESAHIDLYILSVAQHAIVNCPSTFSAFAKRQRDAHNRTTEFWGVNGDVTATLDENRIEL